MSKDSYRREYFGIDPVEQLIQEGQDEFCKKYTASEKVFCVVVTRH